MHDNAPPSNRTLLRELNSAVENCALIQIIKMIPWWIISDRRRSLRALRAPALAQPPGKDTGGKLPPRYAHVLGRGPAVAGLSTAPRDGARGRAGGKRQTILGSLWCTKKPMSLRLRHLACYATRIVTGIPRHVIRLTTLHAIFASVR